MHTFAYLVSFSRSNKIWVRLSRTEATIHHCYPAEYSLSYRNIVITTQQVLPDHKVSTVSTQDLPLNNYSLVYAMCLVGQ